LALGAALFTRTEQKVPAGIETNQRLLEGRRNVHLPRWELAVPVSCRRFRWRHDRLFGFSAERDAAAAKQFFQKALQSPGHPRPWVITVDGNPSYAKEIAELKQERKLGAPMLLSNLPVFKQCCGTGP